LPATASGSASKPGATRPLRGRQADTRVRAGSDRPQRLDRPRSSACLLRSAHPPRGTEAVTFGCNIWLEYPTPAITLHVRIARTRDGSAEACGGATAGKELRNAAIRVSQGTVLVKPHLRSADPGFDGSVIGSYQRCLGVVPVHYGAGAERHGVACCRYLTAMPSGAVSPWLPRPLCVSRRWLHGPDVDT
jgi:hypothetical protein